jgi:hypothetical protein
VLVDQASGVQHFSPQERGCFEITSALHLLPELPGAIMQSTNNKSSGRRNLIVTVLFAVAVLIPSLYGFSGKFIEFIAVFRGESDGVFAITPIVNYLLATLGFFCLFGWALMQGMFSDIERPKQTVLENEEWLDRQLGYAPAPRQPPYPPTP